MKVCIVGDIHFSSTSSILRGRGKVFTQRLENCVESINNVEQYAKDNGCEYVIYLGDFFDKDVLNSEEVTALQTIQWSNVKKIFLVGNHEMGIADLSKSSAHIFNLIPNSTVIDSPNGIVGFGYRFMFLPYILESERKTVREYFNQLFCSPCTFETQEVKRTYVFSHNDIKGIQLGSFLSKEGFDIEDIENNCDIFFNGHLHNEGIIGKKIINVGNLTGQNFSEDVSKYMHKFCILDTDTGNVTNVPNKEAINFSKLEVLEDRDVNHVEKFCYSYTNLVLSVKCVSRLVPEVRKILEDNANVVTYRIVTVMENTGIESQEAVSSLTSTDYIEQFTSYVMTSLGSSEEVISELQRISK